MKIPRYFLDFLSRSEGLPTSKVPNSFLETSSHSVLHSQIKWLDRHLILWRIGKALGIIQ
jgi:hypothetical protein